MKKIILFLSFLAFLGTAIAQKTDQKISDKVKVSFPNKPEEEKLPTGGTAFVCKTDSNSSCFAMSMDLSPMGLSAEVITAAGDALWEQLKGGLVAQMAGATIAKDQVLSFKGKNALYLEIDGSKSSAPLLKGKKAYGYTFFIGAVLHQVMYYSLPSEALPEAGKTFFESTVIEN